ncbi:sugar MFS transporter [Catenovulum sp. 2E275]|uniref:sugar MFS transporter n=1 Tax=Catenovulum sp. 2E275 TaxID=2980497 RepID=UPI0021CE3170|nr:sugar MFS transporter [Catenovulum sp. 2E275]MCU4674099.1 sugar MFS transporter [Catenovulum sp. 2E275]
MAGAFNHSNHVKAGQSSVQAKYVSSLIWLTSLFFIWGFLTSLNDILIPHLKQVFSLNYTQAMLIQSCFFGAYFIVSIPAGQLVKKIGYKNGIVVGLIGVALGCVAIYPSALMVSYPCFLASLFLLASGVTILQVSANPYVTILGSPDTASERLTMTQAFNSLGTTIAPLFGAAFILSEISNLDHSVKSVQLPYMLIALTVFLVALLFYKLQLPQIESEPQQALANTSSVLEHKHLMLGTVGLFLYVGAEVSIGSFLVNFIAEPSIAGLHESQAARYIALYWGGAMIGRFIGSIIMRKIKARYVLAFNGIAAIVCLLIAIFSSGYLAMYAVLLTGLCNSIMFPTIFSLSLVGLGAQTSQASGLLCLAIVGGAILPLIQGVVADIWHVQISFLIPAACYIFIVFFALSAPVKKVCTLMRAG